MNNPKKLTKSRTNRVISGVAGGLGEYLNVDPLIFRILFVVFTFAGCFGALAYLILLIMMPQDHSSFHHNSRVSDAEYEVVNDSHRTQEAEKKEYNTTEFSDSFSSRIGTGKVVSFSIGFLFVIMGVFILLSKMLHFNWWQFVFPATLLTVGIVILILSIYSKK